MAAEASAGRDLQALRWFAATVTFATIVGYQFSGASLLAQYLADLEGKWSRLAAVLLAGGFTALLLCLGGWAFVADLVSAHARLVPVFVIVVFLALVALLAMSAQPSEEPLATNAPPVSVTGTKQRRGAPGRGSLSWALQVISCCCLSARSCS